MSNGVGIDHFVKDPGLLVEMFREVVERHGVSTDESDTGEREAQLSEIAKAIERLERIGVSVPGVLRAEKLRLACPSQITEDAAQALKPLVSGLWKLLCSIRARLPKQTASETGEEKDSFAKSIEHRRPSEASFHPLSYVTSPREARRRAGLNQASFWSRFGVTQSGGSRYESGRDIAGPTQILMVLYACGKVSDEDLFEARTVLGSEYKQSSE